MNNETNREHIDWDSHTKHREEKREPNKPLVIALQYIPDKEDALDIGSGAMRDVEFLIQQGFEHVTAIDPSQVSEKILQNLPKEKLNYIIGKIEDTQLPENHFSIVNSYFALPFIGPEKFDEVWKNIKASLKPGGIFVGQFFGEDDTWAKQDRSLKFHTLESAKEAIADMEIIDIADRKWPGKIAAGVEKDWHVIFIIARKK